MSLSLRALTRHYAGAARPALDAVSLDVRAGELLAIVGESGAGKTTLLRVVAGYDRADAGSVHLTGADGHTRDVTHLPAEQRDVGMVFQHGALFPHLSVVENVAFGLAARGVAGAERRRRAETALADAGLLDHAARDVRTLSGGEQQRVALARSLVVEPRALLLDEPLSSLDPTLRRDTRDAVAAAVRAAGVTTVLVTHDRDDAFAAADRVAVLHVGRVLQVDAPAALYDRPQSAVVARRTGRASLLPARRAGDGARVTVNGVAQQVASTTVPAGATQTAWLAVLRPEMLALTAPDTPGSWPGTVAEASFAGGVTALRVALRDGAVVELDDRGRGHRVGDRVAVQVVAESLALVPAV